MKRALISLGAAVFSAFALFTAAPSAFAATTLVLTVPGVQGSSTVQGFSNDIDIHAFSFDVSETVLSGPGGGGVSGKPDFSQLVITKSADRADVPLLARELSGTVIPHAQIDVLESAESGHRQVVSQVILTNVEIADIASGVSKGSVGTVTIKLAFRKIEFLTNIYDPSGKLVSTERVSYDVSLNKIL